MTTLKLAKGIQDKYIAYKAAQELSDELSDQVMIAELNISPELESKWDETYKIYWSLREELVQELMRVLKIERQTANRMIVTEKFDNLMGMKII